MIDIKGCSCRTGQSYGPAAEPVRKYWQKIWSVTLKPRYWVLTTGKCLLNLCLTVMYVAYLMTTLIVLGVLGILVMAMPQRFGLRRIQRSSTTSAGNIGVLPRQA